MSLLLLFTAALLSAPGAAPSISDMPPVPPAPMQADESVTAFACTLDKVGHGEACSFEGQQTPPGRNQAAANTRSMQDALLGCDLEDPSAQQECERGVKKVSESRVCTLQGRARLVDSQGKLTAAARPCVDALLAVYNRAAHACGKECSSLLRSASPPEEAKPPEPALHPAVTPHKI